MFDYKEFLLWIKNNLKFPQIFWFCLVDFSIEYITEIMLRLISNINVEPAAQQTEAPHEHSVLND